jgi:protocatechuate 3,4-dioxygenase beta subunit
MAKTMKAVLAVSSGKELAGVVSRTIVELVQGVTAAMLIGNKVKISTVLLLAATLLAGASAWAYRDLVSAAFSATVQTSDPPTPAPSEKTPKSLSTTPRDATKGEAIQGRVLDPDGKPVKDAHLHWLRFNKNLTNPEESLELVERGRSDDEGRFHITLPVGEDLGDSLRTLVVTAAGYGLSWIELPKGESSEKVTVRLHKDVTIRGRVLSMEGKPLAGVNVRVDLLEDMAKGRFDDYLAFLEQDRSKTVGKTRWLQIPSKQSPVPAVVTDENGSFQISGVGSERIVNLAIRGKGIAHATLPVVARLGFNPSALNKSARDRVAMMGPRIQDQPPVLYGPSFEYVATPERIIEGVVREAGSGKPIPGVRINGSIGSRFNLGALTDKEGRYRLEGMPKMKRYPYLSAFPPPDSPWIQSVVQNKEAGEGLLPVQVDFTLGRGVTLTGRVIDRVTGKGVVCSITFAYLSDNEYAGKPGYDPTVGSHYSDKDGRFRLKVVPGTGVLEAVAMGMGVSNPFKSAQFDAEDRKHLTLTEDGNYVALGGFVRSSSVHNAVKWMNLAADAGVVEHNLFLERGATAKVRIQDPEGKPLAGTIVSGIDAMPGQHVQEAYVAPEAECTIVALDPSQPRQVIFYHPKRRLAGSLAVRGDEKHPLTVRLAPTGTVTGCIKDADGQPLQGAEIDIGAPGQTMSTNFTYLYLHLNFTGLPVRTNKQGRFRLDGLVPNEKFAVGIRRRGAYLDGGPRTRQVQVKAGQTLDLGDIRINPAP